MTQEAMTQEAMTQEAMTQCLAPPARGEPGGPILAGGVGRSAWPHAPRAI
jgi:hypothetical protein